ncbi:MAG: hypothetical protein HOO06_09885 [Bdellovibrionaceae bacterium]|jgi:hypothetical protein|nr:hypothetical protein [Pseudobdellovibrionaceae bacterium]
MENSFDSFIERIEITMGKVPLTHKMKFIKEIETQLEELKLSHPELSENDLLVKLGEPELLALKYIKTHRLSHLNSKGTGLFKWLITGILIFFSSIILFTVIAGVALYNMTPILEESSNNTKLFGGLITLPNTGQWYIGGHSLNSDDETLNFKGSMGVNKDKIQAFNIVFSNMDLKLEPSKSQTLSWDCEISQDLEAHFSDLKITEKGEQLNLNLADFQGSECKIKIPDQLNLIIRGVNGKINIKELRANLDVKINNGLVKFNPHKSEKYVYQLKVDNGQIDTFKSQYDEKAYKIKIYVNNGQIE